MKNSGRQSYKSILYSNSALLPRFHGYLGSLKEDGGDLHRCLVSTLILTADLPETIR